MAVKPLTEEKIRKLQPGLKRREIPDGKVRGLFYILQPSGAASWALRYRHKGKPRKLTLFGVDGLKEARQRAEEMRGRLAQGQDPAGEKSAQRAALPAPVVDPDSVNAMLDKYIHHRVSRGLWGPRSEKENSALLARYVRKPWGHRKLADIRRRDVHDLLDGIVERGAPVGANRTLVVLKSAWRWWMERDERIEFSPVAAVSRPYQEKARARVLEDDELVSIWNAVEQLGWPFSPIVRLLALTACRREEVGSARWSEFDFENRLWHLPSSRRKHGIALSVPLSDAALAILQDLPRFSGTDLLFPAQLANRMSADRPFSGYGKCKRKLDALSGVRGWVLHDLRRTCATRLGDLGTRSEVIELVLGHERKGIERVYQRHPLLPERAAALQAWAHRIERLLNPEAAP
jgi:integrase